jgi:hypothetical protein
MSQRHGFTVSLENGVLPASEAFLLQAVERLHGHDHDFGVAVLLSVLFRRHFFTFLSRNNDVLSINRPFSMR